MKIKIYAVKDIVQGNYMQPFYMYNDEVAKRSFAQAINDEKASWNKIALDLQLYRLGEFNDETGDIKVDFEYLAKGADYKKSVEPKGDDNEV